jgi:hypothetical protein
LVKFLHGDAILLCRINAETLILFEANFILLQEFGHRSLIVIEELQGEGDSNEKYFAAG